MRVNTHLPTDQAFLLLCSHWLKSDGAADLEGIEVLVWEPPIENGRGGGGGACNILTVATEGGDLISLLIRSPPSLRYERREVLV